jgi:hypothetical protein
MKHVLLLGVGLLTMLGRVHATTFALWSFNTPTPDGDVSTGTTSPWPGSGTAWLLGSTTASFVTGDTKHDPAGSTDNSGWNTTKYPAAALANKSAGVRFDVDTTGYEHIVVSWYQQNSATASRYLRFQYTLDGYSFYDADVIAVCADSYFTNQTVDLSAIPGVTNNPAFGFQLVTEFESTATQAGSDAYLATKSGSTYGTSGTIRFDMVTVSGTTRSDGNTPPYIFGSIPSQTLRLGQSTSALSFTVLDAESPAASLTLSADSSNPGVIPLANITFSGGGAERAVTVKAGTQAGASSVTVWVSDPGGKSNSTSFAVSVLPGNTPPFISGIPRTNTLVNVPTPPVPFTIGDAETPASSLSVSGTSANPALVPNANITFGGSGSNRTVTLTPAPGQTGVAPITVTVSDGVNSTSAVFPVMVTSSPAVIFYEPFSYADGSLLTNSAFLWSTRSGPAGESQVINQQAQVTASQAEDVAGPLIGAPYNASNHTVLYAAFKANFVTLPKLTPGLFAHFANGSTLRGRVYAGLSNAAPGAFRLSAANGSDACTNLALDLHTNTTYTVVTRYDLDNALTALWVNPVAEADPCVTANDAQTATRITSYDFRQDADIGAAIWIDDLRVGLSFAAVTGNSLSPIPLSIERNGANLTLRWTNPVFSLQASPCASGPFTNVPGATTPFTTPSSGPARFFRLRAN